MADLCLALLGLPAADLNVTPPSPRSQILCSLLQFEEEAWTGHTASLPWTNSIHREVEKLQKSCWVQSSHIDL